MRKLLVINLLHYVVSFVVSKYFVKFICALVILVLHSFPIDAQVTPKTSEIDVESYYVQLEVDIKKQEIKGVVNIRLNTDSTTPHIVLDAGRLSVDLIETDNIANYYQQGRKVYIRFNRNTSPSIDMTITYHGSPKLGVSFFPEINQSYSYYFASSWLICNNQVNDKATIEMEIAAPDSIKIVGTGNPTNIYSIGGGSQVSSWSCQVPVSPYTYGFAVGDFNQASEVLPNGLVLNYFAHRYDSSELQIIFRETQEMMRFFQAKSGIDYPFRSYTQVIGKGRVSQEMTGFTVLRDNYGQEVLADSTRVNLGAHELAHQWWGNMVTCEDFGDFWLNEAMAVYMSSAYKQHRFGEKAYQEDIKVYYDAWQEVAEKGLDKPIKFPNWNNPSRDDRVIVYYKGAYFLHTLRLEVGDELFWKALKKYTQAYFRQSATSRDFQDAFEEVCQKDLQKIFDEWVY